MPGVELDRGQSAPTGTGLLAEDELDDLARELVTAERLTVQLDGRLLEEGLIITIEQDGSLGRVEQEPSRRSRNPRDSEGIAWAVGTCAGHPG